MDGPPAQSLDALLIMCLTLPVFDRELGKSLNWIKV